MPFYRSVVTVEVLSDEPLDFEDLLDLHYLVTDGPCSGDWHIETEEVSREKMRVLLENQRSDPAFLLGEEWEEDQDLDKQQGTP
jgi:hypothetical protein